MGIRFLKNNNGPTIGVHNKNVIEKDGLFFRDLEGTGELLPYEEHFEDMPFDMCAFRDNNRHIYDFGFGLNWNGVIEDRRKEKYVIKG